MKQLLIIFLFVSLQSFSQSEKADPIDTAYDTCLKDSSTTAGMCNCGMAAMDAWDKALNANYKLLMKALSQPTKTDLINAQKEWITYRDKEFSLIDKIYYAEMQGTMYYSMAWYRKTQAVKNRAIELKRYYDLIKDK